MNTELQPTTEIKIALKADTLRSDLLRGLVWFVNYAAIDPAAVSAEKLDLHGSAMLPADVETFAHRWLAFSRSVDIEHDGIGRPVHVVESFFNSKDVASPAWPVDAHAVRMDLSQSPEAMDGFRTGRLNCVSLDAFTFNVKRKLPAATTRSAPSVKPADPLGLAMELARLGFPGVEGASDLGDGLVLVTRGAMPPLAVHVTGDDVEVTAAGGAWETLAARLLTSGTLTAAPTMKASPIYGTVPEHGKTVFPIDYTPWDPREVEKLLASQGVDLSGAAPVTPFAFLRADGTGEIPHHTIRGVSLQAVTAGLSALNTIPPEFRDATRRHLIEHLARAS